MPDMNELREFLEKQAAFFQNCHALLMAFDDGPRHCTGTTGTGELVWKGSFIAMMENMREALPPEPPAD